MLVARFRPKVWGARLPKPIGRKLKNSCGSNRHNIGISLSFICTLFRTSWPVRKSSRLQNKPFQLWLGLALFLNSIGCSGKSRDNSTQERQTLLEAEAYKSMIKISKVGLAKGENYLGNQVYYVEGSLTNDGPRVVQRIELTFRFKDSLKQVVLQ